MKQNNKKRQQTPYLDQLEQQYGPDFLRRLNPLFIKKNALRIFKDLANGNIDLQKHSAYFCEPAFTYNLAVSAQENETYYYWCYAGLINNPMAMQNATAQKVIKEFQDNWAAYHVLTNGLNNILMAVQYNNTAQVPIILNNIMIDLTSHRRRFNGYFITIERENDRSYNKIERRQMPNGEANSYIPERQIQREGFTDRNSM